MSVVSSTAPKAEETVKAPKVPAIDVSDANQRPVDDKTGQRLSELDYLNSILEAYVESRATETPELKGPFNTEQEEMAAREQAARQTAQPVTDLNALVKAGVIKAIPAAPAGKKFVIDPKTRKVVLANQ